MKISSHKKIPDKDLIVFDMDGTLTPTKAPMDTEMAGLMASLLAVKKVAVIGGGTYGLFREQFLRPLRTSPRLLKNLFLFPTTATSFYLYNGGWKNMYALTLSKDEKRRIKKAFADVFRNMKYRHPRKTYGKIIEDRGTQITFSALGQDVVAMLGKKSGVAAKERWLRKNRKIKMRMGMMLQRLLPECEVRTAGFTSIDVTKKGIDKAYGLRQITRHTEIEIKDMLFVGDAIFPGGNDYAVVKTGVDYIPVHGPPQTKQIIRAILGRSAPDVAAR